MDGSWSPCPCASMHFQSTKNHACESIKKYTCAVVFSWDFADKQTIFKLTETKFGSSEHFFFFYSVLKSLFCIIHVHVFAHNHCLQCFLLTSVSYKALEPPLDSITTEGNEIDFSSCPSSKKKSNSKK